VRRGDYQATLIVMLGLAVSSLSGYVRLATIAHQLGVGRATDIYLVAFAVPEFFFIALPIVLSPVFIPLFVDIRNQVSEVAAWRFARRIAVTSFAVLSLLAFVLSITAPLYMTWLAPGLSPYERDIAVSVTRVMLPAIGFIGLATLAGAILQIYQYFARPVLNITIYNLTFVVVLLAVRDYPPLYRTGWAVMLGATAALLFQMPLIWRLYPAKSTRTIPKVVETPTMRHVAFLVAPLAAGYVVHHIIHFVDRAMATALGAGSAAALNFSYHLALIIGQLTGLAVSIVLFPRLAEQISNEDIEGARVSLAAGLRFVWMVGLPATVGLLLFRSSLVRILYERGAFDYAATDAVSSPLVWYALAVLADALCQPLWRVVYAQQGMWNVLGINGLQTGVRLFCNIALVRTLGYTALAVSAFIGLSVQLVVLGWLVRRQLGTYLTTAWWRDVWRVAFATAVAAFIAIWLVIQPLGKFHTPPTSALTAVTLFAGGTVIAITYLVVLWLLQRLVSNA
jgi:putative peptidoglycan lipid II flippase